MPLPGTHEVISERMGRPYIQLGGARPSNRPLFYGGETNYMEINGVTTPQLGGITPIRAHAPENVGTFINVGKSLSGANLPEFTVNLYEKQGTIPQHLLQKNRLLNFYVVHGRAKSLADFDNGWEDYVEVFSGGRVTDNTPGDRTMLDRDQGLQTKLKVIADSYYATGAMVFTEKDKTSITLELLDVTYGNRTVFAEYGPENDGTGWIYNVEKGGAGAAPIVHYSLDGGATWSTSSIATAANAEAPCAIRLMGNYLVVLSPTANSATQSGYYYNVINPLTGAPGATWVKVTAGFTNAQKANDMWVAGPREAYICADAGEVLRLTDVPSGPTSLGIQTSNNLARIHGNGDAIVAVGASATVLRSINRGKTWAVTTNAPGAASLQAVHTLDRNRIWVGDASSGIYYTMSGGDTAWTALTLPYDTPAAVQDVRFATDEVGYILFTASSLGRVAATINGGATWTVSDVSNPRLLGIPTTVNQKYNRIAVPLTVTPGVNANNAILVGLGLTTDGCQQLGAGNVF